MIEINDNLDEEIAVEFDEKYYLSKVNEQSYETIQRSLDQNVSQVAVQYQSNSVSIMGRQKYEYHKELSGNQWVKSEKVLNTNVPAKEILPHHLPRPPEKILPQHQPRPPEDILPEELPTNPEQISLKFLEQACNRMHKHFGF